MKGLEIRPFVIEDTDDVLSVWESAGVAARDTSLRTDIQKKLGHSPESFLVGVYEERIVSTVMVGYDGHRGWIYRLAVRPEFQHRGIGAAMVEHAENWLRQQGCPKVKVQVEPGETNAAGFYARLGYETQDLISMGKRFRAAEEPAEQERGRQTAP